MYVRTYVNIIQIAPRAVEVFVNICQHQGSGSIYQYLSDRKRFAQYMYLNMSALRKPQTAEVYINTVYLRMTKARDIEEVFTKIVNITHKLGTKDVFTDIGPNYNSTEQWTYLPIAVSNIKLKASDRGRTYLRLSTLHKGRAKKCQVHASNIGHIYLKV
jgi:hypothetical protein